MRPIKTPGALERFTVMERKNYTDLLRGTIEAVREDRRQRAHDARLEAYAEGTVDSETVAAISRREGTDADLDDELRAFEPMSAGIRERIAEQIADDLASQAAPPASTRRSRVVLLRRVAVAMSALAMAASLAFVLHDRKAAPLPAYELSFVGGEETWRGAASGVDSDRGLHPLARAERLRVLVRPGTTVSGPVEARLFLRRDGEVRPWSATIDASTAGAVRIVASPSTLPEGTEGDWDLVVAIGHADAPPEPRDLDPVSADRDGVRLVTTRIRLAP